MSHHLILDPRRARPWGAPRSAARGVRGLLGDYTGACRVFPRQRPLKRRVPTVGRFDLALPRSALPSRSTTVRRAFMLGVLISRRSGALIPLRRRFRRTQLGGRRTQSSRECRRGRRRSGRSSRQASWRSFRRGHPLAATSQIMDSPPCRLLWGALGWWDSRLHRSSPKKRPRRGGPSLRARFPFVSPRGLRGGRRRVPAPPVSP